MCAVLSGFSRVCLFATLWTVTCQAPLSREFSGKNTGVGCHALLQGIFFMFMLEDGFCLGKK